MNANEAYLLARAYTNKALEGAGALKGAPCQIKSITSITGGHRVTFEWEDSEGETSTETMDVMDGTNGTDGDDGVGISSITYKEEDQDGNYVYTVLLTNSSSYDITCPKGPQGATGATGADGADGNGIASITKTGTSGLVDTYTITYTDGTTSTFTVTNGQDGGSNEFIGTLAEWNALSPAQKKAYDTYQITDDYSEALMPNYSTVPQKTGQKWIDGKDLKFVVLPFDATSGSASIDITGLHIDKAFCGGCYCQEEVYQTYNLAISPLYNSNDDKFSFQINGARTTLFVSVGNEKKGHGAIILYYTETV